MSRKNDPGLHAWVGSALRMRRLAAGLTLKEFAESVEVTTATVARWETEENAPDAHAVQRIAEKLEVAPEDFARSPRVV
mgnify:FL=1